MARAVENLTHSYKNVPAVDDVSLEHPVRAEWSGCSAPTGSANRLCWACLAERAGNSRTERIEVLNGDMSVCSGTATQSARASPTCRKGSARTSIRN